MTQQQKKKAAERKKCVIFSGVLMYFPNAIRAIAQCSYIGNEQHNPGEPMHWAKEKSNDHHDALIRHTMEAGTIDEDDGIRHSTKAAWRALAALETEIEADNDKKKAAKRIGLPPGVLPRPTRQ